MKPIFRVIDLKATEVTTYDKFEIVPPNMDEYNRATTTSNHKYGTMKDVSNLFKDRKLNMIYIEYVYDEQPDSRDTTLELRETIANTMQDIVNLYISQNNSLIISDILDHIDLSNELRFIGFTTMENLLSRKSDKLILYVNDLVGIRFFELGNNIWS